MRFILCLVAAVALQFPAAVYAQQVSVGGWVNSVDNTGSTITIRTLANPRTIQLAPNVVVRINGVPSRLDQIPANSAVSITAERGPTGVLTATRINVSTSGLQPSAAEPPGSVVQGTLVGMNVAANTITVRTTSGDHVVTLGTAPIMVNGVRGSIRNLALGQSIQVRRTLPTPASTDFITQAVWVLPSRSRVAGYRTSIAAPAKRAAAKKRSTRPKRKATVHRSKQATRAQQRARKRHLARARRAESRAVAALSGTAPISEAAAGGMSVVPVATTVAVPGTVIEPGFVYVVPGAADLAVPPIAGVTTSSVIGGIVGTAPVTSAADARTLSAAAANAGAAGIADVRRQTGAINGAAASGIPNPRNQSVVPSGPLGAGVVPAPGVPDPRFQSLTPAVPGMPSGFGRPGFIGPRVVAPMRAPRVTAPVVAPRVR